MTSTASKASLTGRSWQRSTVLRLIAAEAPCNLAGSACHDGGVPTTTDRPTFVYDGDCAFCSSCARFIERRIPTPARVEAWQHVDLAALGLTVDECDAAVQWVPVGGQHLAGPLAIAALLRSSRPWWAIAGRALELRPVLALARPAYGWVSRHRHLMPGGTATCSMPAAERPGAGRS